MKAKVLSFLFIITCGGYFVDGWLYPNSPALKFSEEIYPAIDEDVGEPLILTPYIEANQVNEARSKAKVSDEALLNVTSYSGYFTVDKTFNSNLFFWFFPAEENNATAPVMLWLQGGPGDPSLIGLFVENGPLKIISNNTVELREERWTKHMSVLYIDNPVGTGYSFTNPGGYCQNQTIIGKHLYSALEQFFKMFPELVQNDFFVAGESYGGKYGPSVAYEIHQRNPNAVSKINLKGLALDSGYSDPEHMVNYPDYLYQIGLIDHNLKTVLKSHQNDIIEAIKNGNWSAAAGNLGTLLGTFAESAGFQSLYNYRYPVDPIEKLAEYFTNFVQIPNIRKAIHVGRAEFNKTNGVVYGNLGLDLMKSVAPKIKELLNHYRLLTYNGQLDIIVAYPFTVNYLSNLNFSSAAEYKIAERKIWRVDNEIAGYVKTAGNLTEVLVRNGGHVLVHDQPKFCFDLIRKFVKNEPII